MMKSSLPLLDASTSISVVVVVVVAAVAVDPPPLSPTPLMTNPR